MFGTPTWEWWAAWVLSFVVFFLVGILFDWRLAVLVSVAAFYAWYFAAIRH